MILKLVPAQFDISVSIKMMRTPGNAYPYRSRHTNRVSRFARTLDPETRMLIGRVIDHHLVSREDAIVCGNQKILEVLKRAVRRMN